jgi:hypothetical protein
MLKDITVFYLFIYILVADIQQQQQNELPLKAFSTPIRKLHSPYPLPLPLLLATTSS